MQGVQEEGSGGEGEKVKCRCGHSPGDHLATTGPCLYWWSVSWNDSMGEFAKFGDLCRCESFEEGRAA